MNMTTSWTSVVKAGIFTYY